MKSNNVKRSNKKSSKLQILKISNMSLRKRVAIISVLLFSSIGAALLITSHAATSTITLASYSANNGTLKCSTYSGDCSVVREASTNTNVVELAGVAFGYPNLTAIPLGNFRVCAIAKGVAFMEARTVISPIPYPQLNFNDASKYVAKCSYFTNNSSNKSQTAQSALAYKGGTGKIRVSAFWIDQMFPSSAPTGSWSFTRDNALLDKAALGCAAANDYRYPSNSSTLPGVMVVHGGVCGSKPIDQVVVTTKNMHFWPNMTDRWYKICVNVKSNVNNLRVFAKPIPENAPTPIGYLPNGMGANLVINKSDSYKDYCFDQKYIEPVAGWDGNTNVTMVFGQAQAGMDFAISAIKLYQY